MIFKNKCSWVFLSCLWCEVSILCALSIVVVGALIFFVGWMFAVRGFFSMRPLTFQVSPSRSWSVCGAENACESVFCSHCGSKLWAFIFEVQCAEFLPADSGNLQDSLFTCSVNPAESTKHGLRPRKSILSQFSILFWWQGLALIQGLSFGKRIGIVKRYLVRSTIVGFLAALVCTLWTAYWSGYYVTPWVEVLVILESLLVYWIVWSLALSVVLPAVLSDEFSS